MRLINVAKKKKKSHQHTNVAQKKKKEGTNTQNGMCVGGLQTCGTIWNQLMAELSDDSLVQQLYDVHTETAEKVAEYMINYRSRLSYGEPSTNMWARHSKRSLP